jgi:hypothetical protein
MQSHIPTRVNDGFLPVKFDSGKVGFINLKGVNEFNREFFSVLEFSDGLAAVMVK